MKAGTKVWAAAASIVLLAGCAGQQLKLADADAQSLSSHSEMYLVHYRPMGFMVESTGYTTIGVLVSPLVAGAMAFEGMGLQKDLQLEDPAARIKQRLGGALQAHYKLANLRSVAEAIDYDDLKLLKEKIRTGIVLDVWTNRWGIDNNRAKYSGRARLVRVADETVLWQGTCKVLIDEGKESPTREALVADHGALLKAKIEQAADACADQLARWVTGKAR